MEEWYYTRDGKQQGPVNLETLREMATSGKLKLEDMVWNSTMSDWVPSGEVEGIHTGGTSSNPDPTLAPGGLTPASMIGSWASDPNLQEIEPGSDPLNIGQIFRTTLEITKRNFQVLILAGLIVFGVSMALSLVQQVFTSVADAIVDAPQPPQRDFENMENFEDALELLRFSFSMDPALVLMTAVFQIISSVINLFLSLGMTRICLNLIDGKESKVSMIFGEAGKLFWAVVASIIVFIIVLIGLLFLIIPGIYLAIRLSAVIPALVDRNMSVTEAINYSFKITRGNVLIIFVLWLIAIIGGAIAILITCGMGAIIVGPIMTLGWILCYRWMQYGRRVAE